MKSSNATPMFLIDTNVWLDYFVPGRPFHKEAREFIQASFNKDITLLYAAITSKDLYYQFGILFKREIRRENDGKLSNAEANVINAMAWGIVENLKGLATAVGCDDSDVWLAQKYKSIHSDYEDNFIIAAAQRAKADYLITNDTKLLQHCPVAALTIRDALAIL